MLNLSLVYMLNLALVCTCSISHWYVYAQSLTYIHAQSHTCIHAQSRTRIYMLRIFLLCIFKLFLLCMFNLILVYTWIHAQSLNYIPYVLFSILYFNWWANILFDCFFCGTYKSLMSSVLLISNLLSIISNSLHDC